MNTINRIELTWRSLRILLLLLILSKVRWDGFDDWLAVGASARWWMDAVATLCSRARRMHSTSESERVVAGVAGAGAARA